MAFKISITDIGVFVDVSMVFRIRFWNTTVPILSQVLSYS
jgi:hypothetical protein